MANRILPALLVLLIVREVLHDVFVDAVQREPFLGAAADGHHNESIVAVSGFLALFLIIVDLRGSGRRRLGARDVELGVGRAGRARRGLGQQVADCETVRRSHCGAASRAARSQLKAPRRPPTGPACRSAQRDTPPFTLHAGIQHNKDTSALPTHHTRPTYGRLSSNKLPTFVTQRPCLCGAIGLH